MVAEKNSRGFWAIESLLAACAGLVFVFLCDQRLADIHGLSPWNSADFIDYCSGLLNMAGEDAPWPSKRSQFAGVLPLMMKPAFGVVGAFRAAALVSTFLVGAGLYAWGRLLAGRLAGLLSVVVALGFAPITRLPRMLNYYPEATAFFVIAAAMVCAGLMHPKRRGLAWAGAGIGLALCADVRGLVWAVPWMAAALGVLWWSTENRKQAAKALFIPIAISFVVGRWAYPAGTASFESQLDVRPLYHEVHGSQMPEHLPPYGEGGAFVWGRSGPWRLPQTGFFVLHQLTIDPPPNFPPDVSAFSQDNHLKPLKKVWGFAVVLALFALRKRRRTLAILAVSVAPFAVGFVAQQGMAEIFARFLAQLLPGLAVLLGVGLAVLLEAIPLPTSRTALFSRARTAGAVLLGLAIVLGTLSTPADPYASWRRPWPHVGELNRVDPRRPAPDLNPMGVACVEALESEPESLDWMPRRQGRSR